MVNKFLIIIIIFFSVVGFSSKTPSYDCAKKTGRNYSEKYFEVSITGTRKLGSDDNYKIFGQIKSIRKIVELGKHFKLSKKGIISFDGAFTEIDKDHFRLKGRYIGKNNFGDVDIEINEVVSFGIHGAHHYFKDPKTKYMQGVSHTDYISISKIEKNDFTNMTTQRRITNSEFRHSLEGCWSAIEIIGADEKPTYDIGNCGSYILQAEFRNGNAAITVVSNEVKQKITGTYWVEFEENPRRDSPTVARIVIHNNNKDLILRKVMVGYSPRCWPTAGYLGLPAYLTIDNKPYGYLTKFSIQ